MYSANNFTLGENMKSQTKKMSVLQLTIITFINMAGSGIIMLPANLAQVGTMSILSWLVTAVGALCLAYVFAKCGRFSKRPGGMNGYASYAFGDSGAFLTGWTYAISLVIANTAIALTAVGYAQAFLGMKHPTAFGTAIATILLLWACSIANFAGPKVTGKLGAITVWGVLLPVCGISIIGWFWFHPSLYISAWNPHHMSFISGVSASIAMTLWAFLGLESACANSEAVDNPEKNVPIAVLGGTLFAAIVYIVATNVCAGIIPNATLAASTAPFSLVWHTILGTTFGRIVAALAVVSCTGSLLGWQFTIAAVFKQSADEGYFPKILAKTNRFSAPVVAMIFITAIQTVLALMTANPSLMSQFVVLVDLAVVTNLVPYLLCMAAIFVIQRYEKLSPREVKTTNVLAFISSLYSLYALYSCGAQVVLLGALVIFFGWTMYGLIAYKYDKNLTL